jgi:hypothetical protein
MSEKNSSVSQSRHSTEPFGRIRRANARGAGGEGARGAGRGTPGGTILGVGCGGDFENWGRKWVIDWGGEFGGGRKGDRRERNKKKNPRS